MIIRCPSKPLNGMEFVSIINSEPFALMVKIISKKRSLLVIEFNIHFSKIFVFPNANILARVDFSVIRNPYDATVYTSVKHDSMVFSPLSLICFSYFIVNRQEYSTRVRHKYILEYVTNPTKKYGCKFY